MNLTTRRVLALTLGVFVLSSSLFAADPSDRKTLSADLKRLDALTHVFTETQVHGDQFGVTFWHASKRLADERGPAIIDAVMVLARQWKDEGGLVYVPLVALLPRGKTLEILHHYQQSERESDRVWAKEFIIEFGMSDTKAAAAHYSAGK